MTPDPRPPGAGPAAAYFRQKPLERVLAGLRQRYEELGRVGGTLWLADPTRAELEALRDFLGKPPRVAGGQVRLALADFDRQLRASRFACGLPDLLGAYFGEDIETRPERREAEAAAWARFCRDMEDAAVRAGGEAARWWQQAALSPAIRREWRAGPAALASALKAVFAALADLPGPGGRVERLPVFAQRLTGDPHAFDPDRLAGRLLERALSHRAGVAGETGGSPAGRRAAALESAGLVRDDLSSAVLAAGIAGPDPVLAGAAAAGAALAFPLREVLRWPAVTVPHGVVFVVENPAVFGALLDALAPVPAPARPALVCTSGQVSLAARLLLDRLAEGGAEIRYGGDFDAPGLVIARGLLRRYGSACRLWRMDPADYRRAVRADSPLLSAADRRRLAALSADFPDLVAAMLAEGRVAYQEGLEAALVADVLHGRT